MVAKKKGVKDEKSMSPIEKASDVPRTSNLRRMVEVRMGVLGLRRTDICSGTGISPGRLSLWLVHGVDVMTVRSLRKLACALRTTPAVLLYEGEGVPQELLAS